MITLTHTYNSIRGSNDTVLTIVLAAILIGLLAFCGGALAMAIVKMIKAARRIQKQKEKK